MKKYLLLYALVFGFITNSFTQDISDHAIGLRLASNHGIGGNDNYNDQFNSNVALS